jgi:hypothetical protein
MKVALIFPTANSSRENPQTLETGNPAAFGITMPVSNQSENSGSSHGSEKTNATSANPDA